MTLTWETRQQRKKFDKRIIHVDRRWLVNITLYIVILEDVAPVTIRDTGLPLTYIRCLSRYSGMIREDDHVLTIKSIWRLTVGTIASVILMSSCLVCVLTWLCERLAGRVRGHGGTAVRHKLSVNVSSSGDTPRTHLLLPTIRTLSSDSGNRETAPPVRSVSNTFYCVARTRNLIKEFKGEKKTVVNNERTKLLEVDKLFCFLKSLVSTTLLSSYKMTPAQFSRGCGSSPLTVFTWGTVEATVYVGLLLLI